jgi:SAM-dependent methyltransferase
MQGNTHLLTYMKENADLGKCLVVGCGLGDDAHMLSQAGYDVTAIDISDSAIKWCKERFDGICIEFLVQDVFELPDSLRGEFDFVFESLTIQSLPREFREKIINAISSLLSENGKILVIAHAIDEDKEPKGPPWPMKRSEFEHFTNLGLKQLEFKTIEETTKISSSKFFALYQKTNSL